ncbi:hypothetical protein TSUD_40190 [Trifolium subterraneum]|uniref:Enhancer of polycomb-like protein n=1 Tax=Trifolium subterraneum TaxID=3900 RepID=A0A2Z6LVN2_TRISU|nr:hypothetical protein TSUD_40190 [Trifolium subterraneum]
MPSSGMRRTTRVFGVVIGGDTDHALQSGRRLPESVNVEEDSAKKKVNNDNSDSDNNEDDSNRKVRRLNEPNKHDRFYGIKYSRKRKRIVENDKRKKMKVKEKEKEDQCVLAAIVKPCSEDSEPICSSYASSGIQFFQDSVAGNVGVCRLAGQNGRCQNMNSKRIQTRRTSLRIREAQNPSTENRSNSALPSYSKGGREKSSTGVASDKKLKINSWAAVILSEAKSVMEGSKEAIDSSYCSANILIVESDRCYRVEGAVVTSEERPDLREWHLAVKKDGLTRCTLKADKVMRPCSSNRYTHVRMVTLINGWKLEFSKHEDWIAFRNLYKECAEREIPIPTARFIPVPGVCEVSNYADSCTVSFNRPNYYISTNRNEFYRAMRRRTANYDLDSEDEEWVGNFNNKFREHVSLDDFESTVDALEKTYYFSPDDCYDEKSVTYWCQNLVSKKVVEAVHSYWTRKRKRKYSSMLKIFQSYQSEICPFFPKPLLRKKRSFKRHPSRLSRSNLPVVSHGELDPLDEDVMLKILRALAAKAAAVQKMELAIQKRKEAQSLAEKADLAIYKATMSVRISETTEAGGSTEVSVQHFLD